MHPVIKQRILAVGVCVVSAMLVAAFGPLSWVFDAYSSAVEDAGLIPAGIPPEPGKSVYAYFSLLEKKFFTESAVAANPELTELENFLCKRFSEQREKGVYAGTEFSLGVPEDYDNFTEAFRTILTDPKIPFDVAAAEKFVCAQRELIDCPRIALTLDWNHLWDEDFYSMDGKGAIIQIRSSVLGCIAIYFECANGNPTKAVELYNNLLRFSKKIMLSDLDSISNLAAYGIIDRLAKDEFVERIVDSKGFSPDAIPAMQRCVDELPQTTTFLRRLFKVHYAEGKYTINYLYDFEAGKLPRQLPRVVPFFRKNRSHELLADCIRKNIETVGVTPEEFSIRQNRIYEVWQRPVPRFLSGNSAGIDAIMATSSASAIIYKRFVEIESKCDLLKVGLACHAYKAQHGVFPETLGALVPEFLPEIPRNEITGACVEYDFRTKTLFVKKNADNEHFFFHLEGAREANERFFPRESEAIYVDHIAEMKADANPATKSSD